MWKSGHFTYRLFLGNLWAFMPNSPKIGYGFNGKKRLRPEGVAPMGEVWGLPQADLIWGPNAYGIEGLCLPILGAQNRPFFALLWKGPTGALSFGPFHVFSYFARSCFSSAYK